jgi:hypothetical protein
MKKIIILVALIGMVYAGKSQFKGELLLKDSNPVATPDAMVLKERRASIDTLVLAVPPDSIPIFAYESWDCQKDRVNVRVVKINAMEGNDEFVYTLHRRGNRWRLKVMVVDDVSGQIKADLALRRKMRTRDQLYRKIFTLYCEAKTRTLTI